MNIESSIAMPPAAETYAGLIATIVSAAKAGTPMTLSATKLPFDAILAIAHAAALNGLAIALAGPSAGRLAEASTAMKSATSNMLDIAGTCALDETETVAAALAKPTTAATLEAIAEARPGIVLAALGPSATTEFAAALRARGHAAIVVCLGSDRNLVARDSARALDRRFAKPRQWLAAARSLLN